MFDEFVQRTLSEMETSGSQWFNSPFRTLVLNRSIRKRGQIAEELVKGYMESIEFQLRVSVRLCSETDDGKFIVNQIREDDPNRYLALLIVTPNRADLKVVRREALFALGRKQHSDSVRVYIAKDEDTLYEEIRTCY